MNAGTYDASTFADRFFAMEAGRNLFREQDADGLLYWDLVRHDIYYSLWARCGGGAARAGGSEPRSGVSAWLRDAYRQLQAFSAERSVRSVSPRYLFITASRSPTESGWIDVVADPCIERYRANAFVLETFSKSSKYLRGEGGAFASIPRRAWSVDHATITSRVREAIGEYFQTEIPSGELIDVLVEGIRVYRDQLWYFERLLQASKPAALLVISNGVMKGCFHAARLCGVPAFELQHGLISRLHPAYSYPAGIDYSFLPFLPTALLTFSEFWSGLVNFAGTPKVVIGTQHYHQHARVESGVKNRHGLLVITADRYHSPLRELVWELARRRPDLPILYKLHPQQYDCIDGIRAEFKDCPSIQVCGSERSVAELFSVTDVLLTVQSTVVYEALQARLNVILMKQDNYHIHENVFELVHLCDDVQAVTNALDAIERGSVAQVPSRSFFDPFDDATLDRVLGRRPS